MSAESVHGGSAVGASRELGRALHLHRLARGLSLRRLASQMGLSSHSGLVDYERGLRIPPENLLPAYGRALQVPTDYLGALRQRALVEAATEKVGGVPPVPVLGVPPVPVLGVPPVPVVGRRGGEPRGGSDELLAAILDALDIPLERADGFAAITVRSREIVAIVLLLSAEGLISCARRVSRYGLPARGHPTRGHPTRGHPTRGHPT